MCLVGRQSLLNQINQCYPCLLFFFDWLAARCSESHLSSFADTKTTALSTLVCVRLYHFWATITSNGSPYATGPLSCLVCLSVRLVYCGQTIGWMKMPLGREVCLGPGDIVLDGDPAPPSLVAWSSGRSLVFGRCAFAVLCSTCSWWLTTYVRKPSAIGQPTRPTQPLIFSGSINE